MSDNKIGARQNANFKAVSTAPSFNKTPVGASTPPLPYPTIQDLGNSVGVVPTVKFNGDPVYVLNQTTQPCCKGDDRGTAGGVKSGTVNGEVKPVKGSSTVRAGGKPVIRDCDPCTMNGGNNPGIYTTTQAPSGAPAKSAVQTSSPPVQTAPKEQGWWEGTKREVGKALKDPWEATKGVARGIASITSSISEELIEGATLQAAGEMDQAAALGSLFGESKTSAALTTLKQ